MSANPPFRGGLFPKTLGQSVEKATKPLMKKHEAAYARLLTRWPHIVGPVLAQYTLPQKINFSRDGSPGTLVLAVHSGWALEVQHQEPVILERIAAFFGYRAIGKLALRQEYLAQPQAPATAFTPKARSSPASGDPLRDALNSLAQSMELSSSET